MSSILEKVETSSNYFSLETTDQFLALQIARSFEALNQLRTIASLTSRYPEPLILSAYQKALELETPDARVQRFEQLLTGGCQISADHRTRVLLSLKIERRVIGAALLRGRQLEETEKRELNSDPDKAGWSLDHFLRATVDRLRPELIALEAPPAGITTRRSTLTDQARTLFRELGVPFYELTKQEVFQAYSIKPCRSRAELREIGWRLFPVVRHNNTKSPLDAALLGLLIQVRMQLSQTA
jgi:hypothetical protein